MKSSKIDWRREVTLFFAGGAVAGLAAGLSYRAALWTGHETGWAAAAAFGIGVVSLLGFYKGVRDNRQAEREEG